MRDNSYVKQTVDLSAQSLGRVATPPLVSPLTTVSNALSDSRSLAVRIGSLVERLAGSVPDSATDGSGFSGNGLFNSLQSEAFATLEHVRDANAAIDRLENLLP